MSGTLRATLVPYQEGKTGYTTAVALLDAHSAVFPISATLTVHTLKLEADAVKSVVMVAVVARGGGGGKAVPR